MRSGYASAGKIQALESVYRGFQCPLTDRRLRNRLHSATHAEADRDAIAVDRGIEDQVKHTER